ncbi:hypothetical protein ACWEF6_02765 [Amycolatopsis sp. NPDC004772]
MTNRAEHYAELRRQYPNLSDAWWDLMQDRDTIRDERDNLRAALAYLIGTHTALGTDVPVDALRELLYSPAPEPPSELKSLAATVFPSVSKPEGHGTGCSCCGAGVQQWR